MSIDIDFYAFGESKADTAWERFDFDDLESSDLDVSEDTEQLGAYLFGKDIVFKPAILNALMMIDLRNGSETARVALDEPRRMEMILDFLLRTFVPEQFFGFSLEWWRSIPTSVLIILFERLSVEKVGRAVESMSDNQLAAYGIVREYLGGFKQVTIDFAFQIRPIIAVCKRTGSCVVMAVNNEPDDSRLMERGQRHLDMLCGQWPSLASRLTDAP